MPTVNVTPTTNTFYIAANIIFDLGTGDTRQVLMVVNRPEDASIFGPEDAQNYLNFVKERARNIIWSVEPLKPIVAGQPARFIIKGVQYV